MLKERREPAPGSPEGRPSRSERRRLKQEAKQAEQRTRQRRRLLGKGIRWGVVGLLAAVGLGWLGYSIVTAKRLPPTSMANHVEESPPTRILTTPMRLEVQKHMLEHADGGGPPGVIINYNCAQFECADDVVPRLTEIAQAYPTFVYLAPYPDMGVKIAVTRLGKILVLEDVDENQIHAFIRG